MVGESKKGDKVLKLTTYNTSLSTDSIFINSLDAYTDSTYGILCKMQVDLNSLNFSTQNIQNAAKGAKGTVTITNGIILPKVGHSKSGNPTDSIYLELQYSNEPGVKYTVSGHARTEFEEDEY